MRMQDVCACADLGRDSKRLTWQETSIAAKIADHLCLRRDFAVAPDQLGDGGRQGTGRALRRSTWRLCACASALPGSHGTRGADLCPKPTANQIHTGETKSSGRWPSLR